MKFSRKSLSIPYAAFLVLFVVIPLLLIVYYAFTDSEGNLSFANFVAFFQNGEAVNAFLYSIYVAVITTACCLVIAFPVAYILANPKYNSSKVLIVLFILPMWMNFLLRTLAIREMFLFLDVRLGEFSTILGMIYNFLPFMVLPIYTTLLKIDQSYVNAAADLGATPLQVLYKITIPLSVPGIMSGVLMVFMPSISTFVISDLLSVGRIQLLGNLINLNFTTGNNWNYGSAISLILLILIGIMMFITDEKESSNVGGGLW
ncbi:MAG: ABC transporter permease [Clostridia bacterium]|nr:ABC transporter permease [Clostridia bacterium]